VRSFYASAPTREEASAREISKLFTQKDLFDQPGRKFVVEKWFGGKQ